MKGLVLLVLGVPMFFVTSMIDGATGRLPWTRRWGDTSHPRRAIRTPRKEGCVLRQPAWTECSWGSLQSSVPDWPSHREANSHVHVYVCLDGEVVHSPLMRQWTEHLRDCARNSTFSRPPCAS